MWRKASLRGDAGVEVGLDMGGRHGAEKMLKADNLHKWAADRFFYPCIAQECQLFRLISRRWTRRTIDQIYRRHGGCLNDVFTPNSRGFVPSFWAARSRSDTSELLHDQVEGLRCTADH